MGVPDIRFALLLVLGLASCAVYCRHPPHGRGIPPRCRQASVTPVSCARVPPYNLLPHPDDCELFYYCVSPGAAPICRQCPAHLHFNPRLLVCDMPAAAGCQLHRPTAPPAAETSSTEEPATNVTALPETSESFTTPTGTREQPTTPNTTSEEPTTAHATYST